MGLKTHLFVCLSLGNREDGKNVNVILSPMSHRSARVEMPRSCYHRAWGDRKRPEAPQKQLTQLSLPVPPCSDTFPIPTDGDSVACGHRWPRGNFPSPGRRGRNLHSYLHFLIAPAGFLGLRLALVSMAGFVQTWRTEGGTKRPQWTCHSPASKAAGGAGRGRCGRGTPGTGGPPGQGERVAGGRCAGTAVGTRTCRGPAA